MTKIMKGGIAYNSTANMVALTQTEYDALTTAQKNNGNFYFITDADPSYFSAENIDYDNTSSDLTATNVQDAIDYVNSIIPMWIKQTSGQSITVQVPFTFLWYYADQWMAHVPLIFPAKNTNYSITLNEVIADNIGNITNKCSLYAKYTAFFDIMTTKTMGSLPNMYSTCMGRCRFTITFA